MKSVLSIQSHVVFGHAGNSAATFPMRRLGVDVWPLNTVQFSNHTQYPQWKGVVTTPSQLLDIVSGIDEIGELARCDAVLSGYMGSAEQGEAMIAITKKIKEKNPNAWYFCDPVMGHPEKGCFVASGVAEFFCDVALPLSDIIAPNLLELETLTSRKINTVDEVIQACYTLFEKGPKIVLVKHLSRAGYDQNQFEMLLATPGDVWHISRPLINYGVRQPVGVGDVSSGLLLANLLLKKSLVDAFEHMTSSVYAIMLETHKRGEYELQLVAAQEQIANPIQRFKARQLV